MKPDYIGENKQPRTNPTLVSLDVVECLTTQPSSNSDKNISNLSVAPLPRLNHFLDMLSFFSLCRRYPLGKPSYPIFQGLNLWLQQLCWTWSVSFEFLRYFQWSPSEPAEKVSPQRGRCRIIGRRLSVASSPYFFRKYKTPNLSLCSFKLRDKKLDYFRP